MEKANKEKQGEAPVDPNQAAIKIQSTFRGFKTRREIGGIRGSIVEGMGGEDSNSSNPEQTQPAKTPDEKK
jgi:hypothetical protein